MAGNVQLSRERDRWSQLVRAIGRVMNPAPEEERVRLPGALPILGAAAVLPGAALIASLMPTARASRVDVLQALKSE